MMKRLHSWYQEEGFIQFLLGNNLDAYGAKGAFAYCWFVLLLGCVPPIIFILEALGVL